jgi:hypothetical protein
VISTTGGTASVVTVITVAVVVIVAVVASTVSAVVSMGSTPAATVPDPAVVAPPPGATDPDVAGYRTDGSDLDIGGRHSRLDDDRGIDWGWGGIEAEADSPASAADTYADGELGLG